jgi:cellulose synthase/poly-beta-1,6-N-acetylglucosamine synthase-like glycosyltransferase/Flp pilus assembly protein TadD
MKNRFRQPLMLLTLLISAIYLVYRAIFTFNLESPYAVAASLLLYSAELWGCMSLLLFFLQVWKVEEPPMQPVLEDRTVDVFVPTYNEDVQMLRGTLQACIAMDYPHRTYVLDDGKRAEVKALAEELGVTYITRDNNMHAKAGNLNSALEKTDGEFLIIFDADHVPSRNFITRLIGYFRDENLAMVQTPHAFYNFDTFQGVVNYAKRRFWDEGQLFYKVLQPGKNHLNAVIFAGSAAMFRRKALKEVGYIAVQTITEDMHTGMKIAAKGWKSLYVSERMIAGQGASDVTTFHSQRLRWGEGNLSILAYDNPMFLPGLSLSQRLSYLASIIHWAGGIPKMAIYLTPILMLFTGIAPVSRFNWTMGVIFIAYMGSIVYTMKKVTDGQASMGHVEFFNMASFWTQARSTWRALFGRKKSKFIVTNKRGSQKASLLPMIGPQVILIGLSLVALVWGWSMQIFFKDSIDYLGLGISSGLVLFHMKIALDYVRRAMTPASRRFNYRHMINLPVKYEWMDQEGNKRSGLGVTTDLTEAGFGLLAYDEIPLASEGTFEIHANGNTVPFHGKLRFADSRVGFNTGAKGPRCFRYGIEVAEIAVHDRDALMRICSEYAVPMWFATFERTDAGKPAGRGGWFSGQTAKRETDRPEFTLPVVLFREGSRSRPIHTTSKDLCTGGLRCVLYSKPEAGEEFEFELPSPLGLIRGRANVLRAEPLVTGTHELWECALQFTKFEGSGRSLIQSLLSDRERGTIESALKPEHSVRKRPVFAPVFTAAFCALALAPVFYGIFHATYADEMTLREHLRDTLAKSDTPELLRIYEETLQQPTPDRFRLLMLKDSLERAHMWPELTRVCRKLVESDPNSIDMSMSLAYAYAKCGEHELAREEIGNLRELLDLHKAEPKLRLEADLLFAHNLIEAEKRFEASEVYARLILAYPDALEARREYAGLLSGLGRYEDALRALEGLPLDRDTRLEIVHIHCAREDFAAAERDCRQLIKLVPGDKEVERLLPEILTWNKDFKGAVAHYQRLLSDSPKDIELRSQVAKTLLWSGDKQGALASFQLLIDEGSTEEAVVNGYLDAVNGNTTVNERHAHTVKVLANKTREMGSKDVAYLTRLSGALRRVGASKDAREFLEAALALDPSDKNLRLSLADTLHELGEYKKADALYAGLLPERPIQVARRSRGK